MKTEELLETFEGLIDDSLDATLELQLLNTEKDVLESERDWEYLKTVDLTQSVGASDNYLTMKPLPVDSLGNKIFGRPSERGIFVGTDLIPYRPIPIEQRFRWKDVTHRYYLDMANYKYALCGLGNAGDLIQFWFAQKTLPLANLVNLAVASSTIIEPLFDSRFHAILPYRMAMKYFAIDQGDKSRAWDDRWQIYSEDLHQAMVYWDAALKVQANQNSHMGMGDLSGYSRIVDMDR